MGVVNHGRAMHRLRPTPTDTAFTALALRLYLLGLPFAAIDLPLIFAFYAQKDTVTPVIVGILAVLFYLAVGPALAFGAGWGFLGLVAANSVQLAGHAVIMLLLFGRRFQGLRGYGVLRTAGKAALASLLVLAASRAGYSILQHLPLPGGFWGRALTVALCGGLGGLGYLVGGRFLRIEELALLSAALGRRLRRG